MSIILKMLSKFDNSGIKKAQHGFGGLKKTLAGIGLGIGISQITNLLLESAKAASADQKSTQLLNTQLVRNAGATKAQIKQSDKFIEKLSLQTGIFDDDLRPAYGKFARVTKDVNKAQDLLTLSLDASATTGKPLEKVSNAISQAFVGNRKQLEKLFPSLKTSKDLFGDLEKIVGGAAIQQADPFSKFNNSMDILKEKLGAVILPMITNFVTELTKDGGIVDVVGKFLTDMSNPKTDAGKMFVDIQNAAQSAFGYVKDFFALFGNGDAMKGFGNVAGALVKMLPALIALKGIMMLANAGKSIANLVKAMTLIAAGNAAGGAGREGFFSKLTTKNKLLGVALMWSIPLIFSTEVFDAYDRAFQDPKARKKLADAGQKIVAPSKFLPKAQKGIFVDKNGYDSSGNFVGRNDAASNKPINNGPVTVNVYSTNADPKAVVDAVSKYVKTNGAIPSAWGLGTQYHGSGR